MQKASGCLTFSADPSALLPHRPPFLMIDRILSIGPDASILAVKNLTLDLWCEGYSPGHLLFPNALVLEAMAQTAGVLTQHLLQPTTGQRRGTEATQVAGLLAGIGNCRFAHTAAVGEQLRLEARLLRLKGRLGRFGCVASTAAQVIGRAEILIMSDTLIDCINPLTNDPYPVESGAHGCTEQSVHSPRARG